MGEGWEYIICAAPWWAPKYLMLQELSFLSVDSQHFLQVNM